MQADCSPLVWQEAEVVAALPFLRRHLAWARVRVSAGEADRLVIFSSERYAQQSTAVGLLRLPCRCPIR